ncbi:MAG: phosphotransferase family protein [Deltaproteobacteria bacterium]|nr:MAG: phosphotransferase family protein [Deltaproteobacteria bacterium]
MARVDTLEARLCDYIAGKLRHGSGVRVENLDRIFGGASRETYRFVLHWKEDEADHSRRLILRRDPPSSLIETERAIEFAAYRAFHGSAVPVPEALWLEEDPQYLEHPFFVMEELSGFEASPQAITQPPYSDHAAKLAQQKWRILGEIAKADPSKLGLEGIMKSVAPGECWQRELARWEGVLDEDELCPQPVIRAAIRWLRRNPPPPAQKISVVHADYRTGNFLYDAEGTIHGILDWEMAHLGDPLEDLAWSINPVWRWARDERCGGLAPREDAIRIWEQSCGLRADPDALRWWEVFSSVKGQGIWVSGAQEFSEGTNQDVILGLSSWIMGNAQDRAALLALGRLPS